MKLESFNAYHSYLKAIEPLNEGERGRLFTALLEYSSTGVAPELRGCEKYVFPLMKEQIDRDKRRYMEKCETQSRNASMRWHATACDGKIGNADYAYNKDKDKNKDKGKDYGESEGGSAGGVLPREPVITMPLNTGEEFPILPEQAEEWAGLYPAVDVIQQLRAMRGWLLSNPTKRKTRAGIGRFINSWLSREQDKGPSPAVKRSGGDELLDMIARGEFCD